MQFIFFSPVTCSTSSLSYYPSSISFFYSIFFFTRFLRFLSPPPIADPSANESRAAKPVSNLFTSYSIAQLYRKILRRSCLVGEETSLFALGCESSPASGFRDLRRSEYTLSRIFPERFSPRTAKKSRVSFVVHLARSTPRTICIGASLAYQGESPPRSAHDGATCQCPAVA